MHEQFRIEGHHIDFREFNKYPKSILESNSIDEQEKNSFDFIAKWLDDSDSIPIQTSGSTGPPKTIEIPKEWMRRSAIATADRLQLRSQMRSLLCIPSQYIGGMMMIVRSMIVGMELKIVKPKIELKEMGTFDFAAMIPLQVETLLINNVPLGNISKLIIGGAPISNHLEQRLKGLSGEIYSSYGMTETVSHIALRRLNGPEASSFFSTLEGIYVETGEENNLMINIPLFDDLRVVTTDIVQLKDKSTFKWKGRLDNIINSGGLKIHPEEIEHELSESIQFPFFITAEKNEALGEIVVLVIETDEPLKIQSEIGPRLKALGNRRPRKIYYTKQFARTPNGKIIRDMDKTQIIEV
ncbi:MAG: AMP-binding protein [Flavobacteriales bacterium]|nr:AMP-binding protein [Flavobacteriales bacterium]